jgi:alpha-glucoside transport system substrate-binding protein
MKSTLFTGVALVAMTAGMAHAQDLVFAPGEGAFTWDSFTAWAESAPICPARR